MHYIELCAWGRNLVIRERRVTWGWGSNVVNRRRNSILMITIMVNLFVMSIMPSYNRKQTGRIATCIVVASRLGAYTFWSIRIWQRSLFSSILVGFQGATLCWLWVITWDSKVRVRDKLAERSCWMAYKQ